MLHTACNWMELEFSVFPPEGLLIAEDEIVSVGRV